MTGGADARSDLHSMTGFARASGEAAGDQLAWELKSVNGKGLDIRLRVPPGLEAVEQPAREAIQKRFRRGTIHAGLTLARSGAEQPAVGVNEVLLIKYAGLAKRLQRDFGAAPAAADGLLALRGVIEVQETAGDEGARKARDDAALVLLATALDGLAASREHEGAALGAMLSGHVDAIADLTERAAADPARSPAAIRERLAGQMRLLLETGAPLDEARLAAEAAFLATKADIAEEIDRLRTHVRAARDLISAGGAIGRRLDFLSQEFNRESNTLCSKSNAAAVTAIGLELKVVVDQFREQVQNLE